MVIQIIPNNERQRVPLSRRFSDAIGAGLEGANKLVQQHQESEALKGQGIDPNLPPELRKLMMEYQLKGELEGNKYQNELSNLEQNRQHDFDLLEKQQEYKAQQLKDIENKKKNEGLAPLKSGLKTIEQMRKLSQKGNLGRGSSFIGLAGGKTSQDRAKYSQLGKSLIQLASNIPIRNKAEFEVLAHDLYDPSLPDSAREGILQAMEEIILGNMSVFQEIEQDSMNMGLPQQAFSQNQMTKSLTQQQRPPLSSFRKQ